MSEWYQEKEKRKEEGGKKGEEEDGEKDPSVSSVYREKKRTPNQARTERESDKPAPQEIEAKQRAKQIQRSKSAAKFIRV